MVWKQSRDLRGRSTAWEETVSWEVKEGIKQSDKIDWGQEKTKKQKKRTLRTGKDGEKMGDWLAQAPVKPAVPTIIDAQQ